MSIKRVLTNITHLCIAVNAVDTLEVFPEYVKQNTMVIKTLQSMILEQANAMYRWCDVDQRPKILKRLRMALLDAGWDNCFVENKRTGLLKIAAK